MNVNDLENGKTTISVAGEEIEVNVSDSVKDTLKKVLQDKGIDSFTILVDGKEVTSTSDLPLRRLTDTFENGSNTMGGESEETQVYR